MRVVALYRVSTEKQEALGASLDAQQRRYRELAASMGWQTVAEFRGQESATKAATERAVLQQVLACIRAENISAVWVYEQSRLTRGDELEVALLTRELRERSIRVLVGTTSHDLADPAGSLSFGIQSVVDRHEAARFRERVARGKREKALQGKRTCGKAPYGYINPPLGDPRRGILRPHPEQAPVVKRIFRDVAAGKGFRTIAAALNSEGIPSPRGGWGKSSIRNLVHNPVYLGQAVSGGWKRSSWVKHYRREGEPAVVIQNAYEPLVSPDLWEAAHRACLGATSPQPGLLSGVLHIDGVPAVIGQAGKIGERRGFYRPRAGHGRWVPCAKVDALAWQGFVGLLSCPDALAALLRRASGRGAAGDAEARLAEIAQHRARLEAKASRLVDLVTDGTIARDAYRSKAAATETQLRELDREANEIRRRAEALQGGSIERAVLALAAVLGGKLSASQKRQALRSVVDRMDIELVDGGNYARGRRGRFEKGIPKWIIQTADLKLRCPAPVPSSWNSDRSWVSVPIVAEGVPVPPADALLRALAEAA